MPAMIAVQKLTMMQTKADLKAPSSLEALIIPTSARIAAIKARIAVPENIEPATVRSFLVLSSYCLIVMLIF